MNGYYGLLNIIKTSLQQNGEVNTVTTQDIDVNEIFSNFKKDLFPFANIITNSGTIQKGVTTFSVEIELADLIDTRKEVVSDKFNGITNEIDIYNTTYYTLRRVADQLINDVYTEDLTIVGTPSLEKFKDIKHNACGWLLSFDIEVPNVVSYCVDIPELPAVTCDLSYTENGGEYTITWTSDNAEEIYLNGSKVAASGQIVTTTPEDGYLLLAKRGIDTCFSSFIIAPVDPRIEYANRISQDGGEIVGFDLLANNINAPVGRKVGKTYAYDGDDYSVVRNGAAWEFTRNNKYEKVPIDMPRFYWTNGKQELLVEDMATNSFEDSNAPNTNELFKESAFSNKVLLTDELGQGFNVYEAEHIAASSINFGFVMFNFNSNNSTETTIQMIVKRYNWRYISIYGFNMNNNFITFDLDSLTSQDFFGSGATGNAKHLFGDYYIIQSYNNVNPTSSSGQLRLAAVQGFSSNPDPIQAKLGVADIQIRHDDLGIQSPILTNGQIKTRPADIITNSQGQLANGRYENV